MTVMPSNPKVSICIPAYNHARFLPAAIESALAQTYPNVEIVIWDDGSTDGSLEIARSYAAKYPSVVRVFIHPDHKNLGVAKTSNAAFKQSTGVYWSGLPSDDVLLPDKIEQQVRFLESHRDVGWVYGHTQCIDEFGNLLPNLYGWNITKARSPIEQLIIANAIPAMTVLALRECFASVGRESELIYSDWELWIRMAALYKFGFIAKPLVQWRLHSSNTSVGIQDELDLTRRLEVMAALRRNATTYRLGELRLQVLIDLQEARYFFCLGQTRKAVTSLCSAIANLEDRQLFLDWLTNHYVPPADSAGQRAFYEWLIQSFPASPLKKKLTNHMRAAVFAGAAMDSYKDGDLRKAQRLVVKAQLADPRWLGNRPLISILAESVLGSTLTQRARHLARSLRTK
jgi:glycosyltransferase involved in cell wall biosynthesis